MEALCLGWHRLLKYRELSRRHPTVRFLNPAQIFPPQNVLNMFLPADFPSFDKHCSRADSTLFHSILSNPCHVLHDLLPPRKVTPYNTWPRPHDLTLPRIDAFAKRSFIGLYQPHYVTYSYNWRLHSS